METPRASGENPSSAESEISTFLCHELLYDFVIGDLSEDRSQAIRRKIEGDSETKALVTAIERGIAYAEELRGLNLAAKDFSEIVDAETTFSLWRRRRRISHWSRTSKLSAVGALATFSVATLAYLFVADPFGVLRTVQKTLTQPQELYAVDIIESSANAPAAKPDDVGSNSDEHSDSPGEVKIAKKESREKAVTLSGYEEDQVEANQAAVSAQKKAPEIKESPVAPVVAVETKVVEPVAEEGVSENTSEALRGFVYRAFLSVGGLEEAKAKELTALIKGLGGKKAGQVELGWKRDAGYYYHFSLPEKSADSLIVKLRSFGPVQIKKDPHSRVMPSGTVRYILWVETPRKS